MPSNLDAETEDVRARFVLYLHKQKHAKLCDFLYSLPQGTVSNFIREVLQQYILTGGFSSTVTPLNNDSVSQQRSDASRRRRLPATTPVQAKAPRTQPAPVTVTAPVQTYVAPAVIAPIQTIQTVPAPQQVGDAVPAASPEGKADEIRSLDHLSSLRSLVDEEDDGFTGLISQF